MSVALGRCKVALSLTWEGREVSVSTASPYLVGSGVTSDPRDYLALVPVPLQCHCGPGSETIMGFKWRVTC